jgi:hypothetical protein
MPTNREYRERVMQYGPAEVVRLWESVQAGQTPGWGPGKAFEYLLLRAFQLEGAEIVWPYSVRDLGEELEQIDGALLVNGLHCLVEAKDYAEEAQDVRPIAKMRNQLLRRPAQALGIVFSRSGFTSPAVTLARYTAPQTILLWQGTEIDLAVREQTMVAGLMRKYRYAVTHGWPDLNLVTLRG